MTQIRILSEMLNLHPWREDPLTLHFFNSSYLSARAGCPALPPHMQLNIAPMEASFTILPCGCHEVLSLSINIEHLSAGTISPGGCRRKL